MFICFMIILSIRVLAMVQLLVGIVGRVHLDQATPPSQGPVEGITTIHMPTFPDLLLTDYWQIITSGQHNDAQYPGIQTVLDNFLTK